MPVSVDFEGLEGLSRTERLEHLRRRIATLPRTDAQPAQSVQPAQPAQSMRPAQSAERVRPDVREPQPRSRDILPVPGPLSELLPHGGLVRGSVVSVSGAGSLLLGMLASVTQSGRHAAVIGLPRLSLLAATEMGARLDRVALVPDPGSDPVEVAAVLLDGLDLVVLGLGGASVPPSRARAVVARARNKGATLIVTDGQWGGAEMRLDARVEGYRGLGVGAGAGHGRVQGLRLAVRAEGKALRPRVVHIDLSASRGRVEWTPQGSMTGEGSIASEGANDPFLTALPS